MPPTAFTAILRRAVERVPGALGAIFADWDGEAVDAFAQVPRETLLFIGAHTGVVLNHVQSALHLFHFGEAEELVFQGSKMDLFVHAVKDGYYVVLAAEAGAHLASALRAVAECARELGREMQ